MFDFLRSRPTTEPRSLDGPKRWLGRVRQAVGKRRLRTFTFEHQDSSLSLREGLAEYYLSDPSLLAPAGLSNDLAIGLRAHDASHVVFGCDTSVRGEVTLSRWSLFGAKGGMQIYLRGLRSKETRFLFADFARRLRPLTLLVASLDGGRALIRSLLLRKRWPSFDWERYADLPLAEIRRDFGIRVL